MLRRQDIFCSDRKNKITYKIIQVVKNVQDGKRDSFACLLAMKSEDPGNENKKKANYIREMLYKGTYLGGSKKIVSIHHLYQ